ncbi:MAG TPA: ROK family protein [Pyrinomonadaceae bacterium]|nr:ROK family protein [Pyrinomonadaceae bacterium]
MPSAAADAKHYVGVDFGGTKIYAGVFTESLQCLGTARISTKSNRGPEGVIERLARSVTDAVDECDLNLKQVTGIGIGAPGAVDSEKGKVIVAPNLDWQDVPLKKELERHLGVPVFVENDCNLAMLGVYVVELESKPRHALGIFIGTGIGGGIVLNGEFYTGANHTAGEIGHMVLQADNGPLCGCGNKGCFEALASRTAIFRRIQDAIEQGQKTILTEILGKNLEDMRSGDLRRAIRRGDKFVKKIVEEAAHYTGVAVANLMNILNPDVVVLGGGIIEALEEQIMPIIKETAMKHALKGTATNVTIRAAKLADDAGIVGGAVLARKLSR